MTSINLINFIRLNLNIMKKPLLTIITAILTSVSSGAFAQKVYEGSNAFTYQENNNNVIKLQESKGNPAKAGDVKVEFYGHMAFKLTSPEGLTVLIDPWRNDPTGAFGKWFTRDFPSFPVDVVLSTHAHFDHDAVHVPHASMSLERLAGEFKLGDVEILGIAGKHQCMAPGEVKWDKILREQFKVTNICPPNNSMAWDNVIYVVKTGGLRIGFWSDNEPMLTPDSIAELKNLDMLVMNISGDEHILSYKQVENALAQIKPKAIIPAHYFMNGLTDKSSGLKTADEWVAKQKNKMNLTSAELIVNPDKLLNAKGMVYYFGDNAKTK